MNRRHVCAALLALTAAGLAGPVRAAGPTTLLNVSYDVMRDFYKDFNPAFAKAWAARNGGEVITVNMSHGGSSRQASAVVDGLEADIITMNQATDIDLLARNNLVPADWAKRLPDRAAPFTSATVFLVRKGNPKGVKDWGDLVKPGIQVVIPNPKLSGNGRYSYLTAWGFALRQPGGNEARAREFVAALFKNVPLLDSGGRAATTSFMQRQIGDVLVTFENEAEMIAREFGRGGFEVVYPSLSIRVEPPVSIVDKVVDRRGSRALATAYAEYLWSPEGQEIAAQNYLRPRDAKLLAKYAAQFPPIKFFGVEDSFGDWSRAQKTHFDDGGLFDQIYVPGGR
ncbi:sulfate ABC transporter substrate-binding protein [Derxia lacustris]|uniref:sulfate ABC transporter substrate-binding protein n=1 Tax=Derxia lacustris TaxID=764842 RepID=UPI000A1738DE|nr:sulfate ABC transporter substrate-binding protein [Derxia lacustris]